MAGAAAARPEPVCPFGVCDGSGWILGPDDVARACECRERIVARARQHGLASVIPARYRGVGFDRPPVPQIDSEAVRFVRNFVEEIGANLDAGRGLVFSGKRGTGKTTLAMLISKAALEAGRTVAIYSLPKLLASIRRTYGAETGEQSYLQLFERLAAVDLLHVDDLGAEKSSDWVLEQLYSLVNERYERKRSIVATTDRLELDALEAQIGARTVSRLAEMCYPLPLENTEDVRYHYKGADA